MNIIPKRLKKEPLIEAIWQIQFEPQADLLVGDLLPGIIFPAMKKVCPGLKLHLLPTADIPVPMAQIDPNLKFAAKYRMDDASSPFIFQVGYHVLTVNCKTPYAGWEKFKKMILDLISIIEGSTLVPRPQRHSLRYLDLISLDPQPDLSALQLVLTVGGENILRQPMRLRIELPDKDCIHVVQIGTPVDVIIDNEKRTASMLLDIETFSLATSEDWATVKAQIDFLHERSKNVFFEKLLTAKTIERLGPEY